MAKTEQIDRFMKEHKINSISPLHEDNQDQTHCPGCDRSMDIGPRLTGRPCEVCGVVADLIHCTGFRPEGNEVICLDACFSCLELLP